jgi:hypothetical protein
MLKKISFLGILILLTGGIVYTVNSQNPTKKLENIIKKDDAKSLAKRCAGSGINGEAASTGSRECYLEYFKAVLELKGPKIAVDTLATFAAKSSGLNGECHGVGHLLGQYAWTSLGVDAFGGDLTTCAFSYGHGMLQAATKVLEREELTKRFMDLCVDVTDSPGCLHGFGHATRGIGYDVTESAALCELEAEIAPDWGSVKPDDKVMICMEGWSMEDFTLRNLFWITVQDPAEVIKMCAPLSGAAWAGCSGSAMRNFIVAPDPLHESDAQEKRISRMQYYYDACQKVEDDLMRRCMNYMGMIVAEVYSLELPNEIAAPMAEKYCSNKYILACMGAVVNSRWNRMGNEAKKVYPYCTAMKITKNRELCFKLADSQ